MNAITKQFKLRGWITGCLTLLSMISYSQMSYEEFHAKYEPHYETLAPDAEVVKITNESDAETGGLIIQLLMEQDAEGSEEAELKILAILTSCKRQTIANILKEMKTDLAVKALNYLKYEWQYELVYFLDKTTYHNIAPNLLSMLIYDGPKGPFGPEIGNWSPAYAGLGFDMAWSGMKGFNNVIEGYGDGTKQNWNKGLGAFIGFRTKNMNFVEFMYQNRSISTDYQNPIYKDAKFGQHTVGINVLKGNGTENAMFVFNNGFGAHANFASWSTKDANGKVKVGSGINGGISYNAQLFINPIKSIPLMFGLRGYAQLNFPRHDFNSLADDLNGWTEGTSTNEDNASVISTFGVQAQVMYKFGKKKDPTVYKDFETEMVENVDPHINTAYTEILPIISPDGNTLYFVRSDHPQNHSGSMKSQDVWMADVTNGMTNANAVRVPKPLNTQQYNMIAGVSPDGNSMLIKGIFDKDMNYAKKGYSMVYRTATGWSEPEAIDIENYENMAKGAYVGAYWTQDGKHLVMSFSESSTNNSQDLYVSHKEDNGTWTRPKKLGATINTDGDDHSPFLASDGKTLYFSSNRDGGLGNNDIWMSKRKDDSWTNWTEPVNLGEEINTDQWDAYYSIDAQGKYAYMASSKNSNGKEDIVRIKLKEEVQPDPVVLIKGKVLNQKTNEPVDAIISYNGIVDGKNYGTARTNPATGEYTIVLPYGNNYDFTASAANYIGVSDNLDLTDVGEYKVIERDLYLVPIEVGATVRLNNIFFETGKDGLKNESFTELMRVVEFLKSNPNVKIELSGHTDNVGDKNFNKTLSQKRADTVLAYLTANGIDKSRLVAKGYGMEKPVAENATEEGKAMNRRVEFTILEK
ncbi:MAG: OmpA family protein [Crocinitomicaceae bacterium]